MTCRLKATTRKPSVSMRVRIFPAFFDSTASGLMMAKVFSMRAGSIRRAFGPSCDGDARFHKLRRMNKLFSPFERKQILDRLKGDEWGVLMHKHLDRHL